MKHIVIQSTITSGGPDPSSRSHDSTTITTFWANSLEEILDEWEVESKKIKYEAGYFFGAKTHLIYLHAMGGKQVFEFESEENQKILKILLKRFNK